MRAPQDTNWLLVALAGVLTALGIAFIYSAGQLAWGRHPAAGAYQSQIVWAFVGVIAMLLVTRVPLRVLEKLALPIYLLSLGVLVLTLGLETGEGPSRWIRFGGLQVQPSEFRSSA